jgi:ectoine hydroxylase-related dioxygenase (phytanoyl-CoA dioxygenase family)
MTGSVVDSEIAKRYRDKGAAVVRGAIGADWIKTLLAGFERNLKAPGPNARHYNKDKGTGFFFADAAVWQAVPEFRDFMLHSPAARIAGELMGTGKVNLFFDNIFIKDTGTTAPTPWHHDLPYVPMAGEMCSLWLALNPVPLRDSPRYVAGSHRWGREFRPRSFFDPERDYDERGFDSSALAPMPDIDARLGTYEILAWEMDAGDVQAFDGLTVHSAPGNTSGQPRRTFVSRWAAEGATFADRGPETYPVFSGCGLRPGQPLDSTTFPVAWRR